MLVACVGRDVFAVGAGGWGGWVARVGWESGSVGGWCGGGSDDD